MATSLMHKKGAPLLLEDHGADQCSALGKIYPGCIHCNNGNPLVLTCWRPSEQYVVKNADGTIAAAPYGGGNWMIGCDA